MADSSSDNKDKYKGFVYQKLVALQMCLDAKPNSKVYLEFLGDASNEHKSVEVKHHIANHYITSNSVDVWKTLRNHVRDFDRLKPFERLVLFTTSAVREDSIFHDWNDLTLAEKFNIVSSHSPSYGVKVYQSEVLQFHRDSLDSILNRFEIVPEQMRVEAMWDALSEHSMLVLVPKKNRRAAISVLIGHLEEIVVFSEIWEVDINDFRDAVISLLSPYVSGAIPFPIFSHDECVGAQEMEQFIFVEKMRAIKLKDKEQHAAFSAYLRALQSEQKMLSDSPVIDKALSDYAQGVKEHVEEVKSKHSYALDRSKLNTDHAHGVSRSAYFEAVCAPHAQISGVKDTQKYFRDGKIHQAVNDSEFAWIYREEDL